MQNYNNPVTNVFHLEVGTEISVWLLDLVCQMCLILIHNASSRDIHSATTRGIVFAQNYLL